METIAVGQRPRRFSRRPPNVARPIEHTPRDDAIIRVVGDNRFSTSHHIVHLLQYQGFSEHKTRQRLRPLYDHGLIDKVDLRRLYWPHEEGSKPHVYALADKGAELYEALSGVPCRGRWRDKNREIKKDKVEHELLITDVVHAFEHACSKRSGSRMVYHRDVTLPAAIEGDPFKWRVEVPQRPRPLRLPVEPDKVLGLQIGGQPRTGWFFLEADCATMGIMPQDLRLKQKTTLFHKFVGYHQTYMQGMHGHRFGFDNFRVLIVTSKTMQRARNMMKAALAATGGNYANMFLFATADMLVTHTDILNERETGKQEKDDILAMKWLNAAGEERRLVSK